MLCCERPDAVLGMGPTDTGVVIIGIAPGRQELAVHQPFVGPSGELLNAVLDACDWPRSKVYTTNLCCSFNNEPSKEMIASCAPRLRRELQACAQASPKGLLIITLGKLASEVLFKLPFGKIQGAILNMTDTINLGVPVAGLATFHPSGILQSDDKPDQQNDFATSFAYDLQKIKPYMLNESHTNGLAPLWGGHLKLGDFELVTNSERAQAVLDSIDSRYSVVLDIETDYDKDAELADPFGNILCVGLRFSVDDTRRTAVFTQEALVGLKWPSDLRYTGHYLYGFDRIALKVKFGIDLPIVGDTFIKSYVFDERTKRGLHKLKPRSREYCGAGFYEDDRAHDASASLYTYNANDVYYTDELDQYFESRLSDNSRCLYYDLLMPAAQVYSEAQYHGVKIDREKLFYVGTDILIEQKRLTQSLREQAAADGYTGVKGEFNLNSWQQVIAYLTKYRGHKINSTAKAVLETLDDQWVFDLLKNRRYTKAYATYIEGVMRQIKFDGRVHPKCMIPGTRTGRPSYIDPPVNTLPHARSIGELAIVRSLFIPDDDAHVLMELDYNQIELFVLAALSQDANLWEDLTTPWHATGKPNYHSRTCEVIIGGVLCPVHGIKTEPVSCLICRKWEFDRDAQKHVNFTIPYLGTAMSLHKPPPLGTGQPLDVCQGYIDAWYARNVQVQQWQYAQQDALINNGVVSTPFGREFRAPLVLNAKQLRQIVNAPVQSIASDHTMVSAIQLTPLLKQYDSRLLWTTYDSMLLHVHKDHIDTVRELAIKIMTTPKLPNFPSIGVDVHVGENLYEVSESK